MAVTWGFLSCMLSLVNNVEQVYAIRALTAFVEASTFSGSHYLLGSWYRSSELGKRSALFACSAQLGCAFVAERSPLISRSPLLRHPAGRHLRLAQRQRRSCGLAVRAPRLTRAHCSDGRSPWTVRARRADRADMSEASSQSASASLHL